jgi:histidinol phosphatase-like enzyme (inositol monophosphatase family)
MRSLQYRKDTLRPAQINDKPVTLSRRPCLNRHTEMTTSLLEAVDEVVRLCGDVAHRRFRTPLTVEWKADGSEVTAADREAEAAARDWIHRRFPGDGIIGEELGTEGDRSRRRWLIDPIDGTRSFVRGVPLWGSLIAVELGGTVLAGAINCPAAGDLVVAARGEGCWHNGARTSVSTVGELSRATILATDQRFRRNPSRATRWASLSERVAMTRSWGDCYGYVLVATGRAELMADDRMSPWDVAALVPVVEEAGGVFTDWNGRPGIGPDAIATNSLLSGEFRRLLGVPETTA